MAPHVLELPSTLSPDALDTITEMASILTRLRTTIQASSPSTAGGLPGATPAGGIGIGTGATPIAPGSGSSPSNALSLKELPAATDAVKHKLQRARVQVRSLADMDRTIAEQESEITELETRIARQKAVLELLHESGVGIMADEGRDTKMEM
jgi:hypothetical protein